MKLRPSENRFIRSKKAFFNLHNKSQKISKITNLKNGPKSSKSSMGLRFWPTSYPSSSLFVSTSLFIAKNI